MEKEELVEQNISEIKACILKSIDDAKNTNNVTLRFSDIPIIVGNEVDDYDFVLLISDGKCDYCKITNNKVEVIEYAEEYEENEFDGRIIFQLSKNGNLNKLQGVRFEGNFYQLENCHDECVCDTCSLQDACMCNNPCFCDLFNGADGTHMVNKGSIEKFFSNQDGEMINQLNDKPNRK